MAVFLASSWWADMPNLELSAMLLLRWADWFPRRRCTPSIWRRPPEARCRRRIPKPTKRWEAGCRCATRCGCWSCDRGKWSAWRPVQTDRWYTRLSKWTCRELWEWNIAPKSTRWCRLPIFQQNYIFRWHVPAQTVEHCRIKDDLSNSEKKNSTESVGVVLLHEIKANRVHHIDDEVSHEAHEHHVY